MTQSRVDPGVSDLLNAAEIAALARISSPTVANAIETFDVRPRSEGVTHSGVECLFPELGTLVGYACTAVILSAQPAPAQRLVSRTKYWEYTQRAIGPKLTVVQDLSERPGGAYWGEVNSSIHMALGSLGVITNGTVRDIEEVRKTGFQMFASGVSVSHGFAHLEDFDLPVKIFGMIVHPGDLVHADRHGAVVIPHQIARHVAKAADKIEKQEKIILDLSRSPHFTIERLDTLVSPEY